ncbi:DIP1984 family protein [Paenibacillus mucilaginosus]|uniref:Septicolysin n=2 Tax=Paenibacillus mucilaginosus TaxID=61624 RepID=I0BT91_9BACL|nr:DIP1984 family protein [Paenibacillus mucilaginosus]AEI45582.1 septicolysin [Paenibacillus mucilaginosus KNP414]AFH65588.1 septicolysin [Paenibacillus mucilaginosus K02]MCG7215330.1 DIP1984 family protein [Paenibacillus mucilaginosus]WDM26993.1 DIP1984 family protein [Paenibacillus mucilaginosus]
MKLAEALMLRADCLKRIEQLKVRLVRSAKVQEGELPGEKPEDLFRELSETLDRLESLIIGINRTNSETAFRSDASLAAVLAERDILAMRRTIVQSVIEAAAIKQDRYSKSEVKFVPTVGVAELQKQVDGYAKAYRELDMKIQELNWQTDLVPVSIDG